MFITKELMHQEGPGPIADDESLLDRGVIDSLGLLQLLAFLETEYRVKIRDEDVIPEHFESINAISEFIAALRSGASRP